MTLLGELILAVAVFVVPAYIENFVVDIYSALPF